MGSAHPTQLPRQSLADIAVPGQELVNEKNNTKGEMRYAFPPYAL